MPAMQTRTLPVSSRRKCGKERSGRCCIASTGSPALAETGLRLGLSISFSGIATFKTSDALRAIAKTVPLERMLVETDAPFLAPMPYRGKRNEPAFVAETARVLAELKGLPPADFAAATTRNVEILFDKITRPGSTEA